VIRQLFKTGNSIVLSLPKEILNDLGMKKGEKVNLEIDRERGRIIISPVRKTIVGSGVDEDFARQVNDFIETYRPALDELAK
jgi:putative addiction module antidote